MNILRVRRLHYAGETMHATAPAKDRSETAGAEVRQTTDNVPASQHDSAKINVWLDPTVEVLHS